MADTSPIIPIPSSQSPARPSASPLTTTSPTLAATSTSGAAATPSTNPSTATQTTTTTASTQSASSAAVSASTATPLVTTSGGVVQTITSTVVVSTVTPTSQNTSTTSNSFFSNKGAVAGVFTVVGLIVFALIIALIVNAIRRRRAEKFDRDVAEAAAEAAASSHSPFDDYSYPNAGPNSNGSGGGGVANYGYSDNSHGTYQLPPMSPQNNVPYGMSEMSQYDPYAAGAASLAAAATAGRSRGRKDSEPGAPGLAGVGAGTLAREPSKRAPYHAFAGPAPPPHEFQGQNGTFGSRRSNHDVLEAAGLAGAGAAAAAAFSSPPTNTTNPNNGGTYVARKPSDTMQHTQFNGGRSKIGSVSSGGHYPTTLQPGYPVESYYPQRNEALSPDPFAGYPITTVPPPQKQLPNPHGAGPSIVAHQSDQNVDYVDSGSPTAFGAEEQRMSMSYQDDADYSQGHRVLRVANQ